MNRLIRCFALFVFLATPVLLTGCSSDDELTAPTSFTATYDSGSVHTTWAGAGNEDMFMVMRVEPVAMDTQMWQVSPSETSYDDSTAESGKTYTYMVHAMIGEDISEPSNKVMVTIP